MSMKPPSYAPGMGPTARRTRVSPQDETDATYVLSVVEGPVDHLDHASYQQFWGGKAGIDATRKWPEEGYTRDGGWPEMVLSDPETAAKVDRRWKEYGL